MQKSETYTRLKIAELAFGLVQFWPAGENLPDQAAMDDETYYRCAINRLSEQQQWELVVEMLRLTTPAAKCFTKPAIESSDARRIVLGVIDRFPKLCQSLHAAPDMNMIPALFRAEAS
jgi:hypothetical protein